MQAIRLWLTSVPLINYGSGPGTGSERRVHGGTGWMGTRTFAAVVAQVRALPRHMGQQQAGAKGEDVAVAARLVVRSSDGGTELS